MNQVIGLDWDHTIWLNEEKRPADGVHEAFDKIKMAGHSILIHSCNSPSWIREMCEKFNLRPDYIWGEAGMEGNKPNCACYCDDRAVQFKGNWEQAVEEILSFVAARPSSR